MQKAERTAASPIGARKQGAKNTKKPQESKTPSCGTRHPSAKRIKDKEFTFLPAGKTNIRNAAASPDFRLFPLFFSARNYIHSLCLRIIFIDKN
ncbi:MAG: hypothetical protein HPZ86_01325 [Clostridia bacterium]|nr:hypothetical protein [Clostridia bacterium]